MSTLRFVGDSYNRAQGTRDAFGRLSDRLVAEGHPAMTVTSGDRESADQLRIWHERMTLTPGNRRVYGTARWQGKTWYRIHPDAVAVPNTSNHEKRRSNDLAWPYNSNTAAHRRAQELARDYGITCEGMGFREWWHWTHWGHLGAIGAPAGGGSTDLITPDRQEDDMATLITGGGQNLVIGDKLIALTPDQVPSIKGAQVIEVHPTTHYNIIQAFQRAGGTDLPVRVFVKEGEGNGTVYILGDGKLTPLVDPTTLIELDAKGGISLTLSQAEVENLLAAE